MRIHLMLVAGALVLPACDAYVKVQPKEGPDKVIVNPPEKTVENHTTIVNPTPRKP